MTNRELIQAYIKKTGVLKRGSEDNPMPLLPFLIMDIQYQIFCKEIRPVECRHQMNRYKHIWAENYNRFNQRFFRAFTPEQVEAVGDMMEGYEEYVANDVMIARVALMNELSDEDFSTQQLLSAVLLCNTLVQCASIVWSTVNRDACGRRLLNPELLAIRKASSVFVNGIPRKTSRKIDFNEVPMVDRAVRSLEQKMVGWVREQLEG